MSIDFPVAWIFCKTMIMINSFTSLCIFKMLGEFVTILKHGLPSALNLNKVQGYLLMMGGRGGSKKKLKYAWACLGVFAPLKLVKLTIYKLLRLCKILLKYCVFPKNGNIDGRAHAILPKHAHADTVENTLR